jgi:hypothetical protein
MPTTRRSKRRTRDHATSARPERKQPRVCLMCGTSRDTSLRDPTSLRLTVAAWIRRAPVLCHPCWRKLRERVLDLQAA